MRFGQNLFENGWHYGASVLQTAIVHLILGLILVDVVFLYLLECRRSEGDLRRQHHDL